jgi:formate dehydrogenase subunit delta
MTTIERLVTMANQIAANRMHEPDPAAATAEHMRLFWDPRMKRIIREHDGGGLSAVAAAAIEQLGAAHDGA